MEDVAARAGVSRALVSIVFRGMPGASEENRARVMQAANELSYRPDQRARLLGRTRSRTIGVTFGLQDEFHGQLVETLYSAAERSGYELILSPFAPTRREERATQALLDYRCAALVLIGPNLNGRALDALCEQAPVVLVSRPSTARADAVRTDDVAGARMAVEHLISLGHERIAHIHGRRAAGANERRAGYRMAMAEAGLDANIVLVAGGRADADGRAAADELLDRASGATAVFTFNDHCSFGLITRLGERGISVPGDLSIVGYDNTRQASSPPWSLTTVAQDSRAIARRVLDQAIHRADHPDEEAVDITVAPDLVLRGSTKEPITSTG